MDFEYGANIYKLNPWFDRSELLKLLEDDYDKFENEVSNDMRPVNCNTHQDKKYILKKRNLK